MRCRTCDYALWNLTARLCPECGAAFLPRDFEFVPNTVRFCCPHCDQVYYGTSETGHLEPDLFECVSCGERIAMDQMVLRPHEGLAEQQTQIGSNPWLQRHRRGRFKAWCATIGSALVTPVRLARGTPQESSVGQAAWFALTTLAVTFAMGLLPFLCFGAGMPFFVARSAQGTNPPVGQMVAIMAGGMVVGLAVVFILTGLYLGVWALVTHGILRVSGSGQGPLRTTFHSICYSSGTVVTSIVPCVGNLAIVWWIVSAVLMVKESHRVHGVRATFAVLTFPVCAMVLIVAAFAFAIIGNAATSARFTVGASGAQAVVDALIAHAAEHNGQGPAHGLQLIADGRLNEWQLIAPGTMGDLTDIPVAGMNLFDVVLLAPLEKQAVIQRAAASLPADVVAHRVGDFVFTFHGAVLDERASGLWVVVMCLDPDTSGLSIATTPVTVGTADGSVQYIVPTRLAPALAAQNRLRRDLGLPPLPDPRTVTHDAPPTAGSGE